MRWLFRVFVDDDDRRTIENDLAELYELRRQTEGEHAANRWRRRQRVTYPFHLLFERLRSARSSGVLTMAYFWRDVAHSVRSLARTPALAATIVLTVGLGLGATTGMMSVIRAVLINPLPYADPDALFWIYTDNPPFRFRFSVVDYRAIDADHPTFTSVAAYQTSQVTVTRGDLVERVTAKTVTGSYFPLLGQKPHLGRLFDPSDDGRGEPLAVLTHVFWSRRFAADPAVVGQPLTIDGRSHTIAGVLQEDVGPLESGVALFTAANWPTPTRKGPFFLMTLARLRPGVSQEAATSALRATNARLFPIWRSSYQDEKATWGLQDLKSRVVGDVASMLFLVLAAVGCVLLIACANAVNLLVARALTRGRELAIRGALGASRARLALHSFAETTVLTLGSAAVGLGVAFGAIQLLAAYATAYIPRTGEIRLSGFSLLWLAALSGMSGLIIGVIPTLQHLRLRMDQALRSSSRGATDGPAARRLRRALVAGEFALATPLIVAAVLLLASLDQLGRVPVGVEIDRTLTASLILSGPRYGDDASRREFWKRAADRLAALPGVQSVALADSRPPVESGNRNNFNLEDRPTPPGQNQPICTWVAVSPGFFRTVGMRLERGRWFDEHLIEANALVVDRAWANRFFPGEEVVGRRLASGGCTTCPPREVIGVVSDVKWTGLEATPDGTIYTRFDQPQNGFLILRTAADPSSLARALEGALKEIDSGLPLTSVATGEDLVANALVTPRYLSLLLGMFALTALVLSVVGIYGVMAHFVQQHTRDIGIRLALGGDPSAMRRYVVAQGLRLVVAGVAVGVVTAFLTTGLLTSELFGVSPTDLPTMAGVPAALVAVAVIACLIPARRAARLNPVETLREG
jgi:putative ABC transport system permease protein